MSSDRSLNCTHPEGECSRRYEPYCAVCEFNHDLVLKDTAKLIEFNVIPTGRVGCYVATPKPMTAKEADGLSTLGTQVGGSHYTDMKIQPIEFIVANKLEYRVSNVIKYACRHANKNGVEDINKAIHYLEMIKETDYAEVSTT